VCQIIRPRLTKHRGDLDTIEVSFLELPGRLFPTEREREVKAETRTTGLEKALYRLLLVGAIADYMKDYQRRSFLVQVRSAAAQEIRQRLEAYLRRYATEYEVAAALPPWKPGDWSEVAVTAAAALIDYIYATIEKRRRRAIGQILQAARDAVRAGGRGAISERFREQLLAYLEESEFTKPVNVLATRVHPREWFELLAQVRGMDGITKLLGACRRKLEESPSHPGLLLLAGLCRTASPYPEQGPLDVRSSFIVLQRYFPDPLQRVKLAEKVVESVHRLARTQADVVLQAVLEADPSRPMARFCYENAGDGTPMHEAALGCLASGLVHELPKAWGAP
jgi:hypothetical protein